MLSDHFEEPPILNGEGEPPFDEARCEDALIKKVFYVAHKENIKKIREVLRKPGKL